MVDQYAELSTTGIGDNPLGPNIGFGTVPPTYTEATFYVAPES
jgi:hypothetical protein